MKQRQMASAASGPHGTSGWILGGLLVVLGLLGTGTAAATSSDYVYLSQFGSFGSGPGQFIGPPYDLNFVAFDPSSHDILVEDGGNNRVQIFTSDGTYLRQFGSQGVGNGQFNGISGVAVDPGSHNIAVADGNGRIQIFTSSGAYLRQFGSPGSGNGQFNGLGEIAIDPVSRNIVVSDNGNDRIQIFSASGVYLGQFGSGGSGHGQFLYPLYLTIDPNTHNILVGDEINCNVQIFSPNGTYLWQFGSCGSGNGQFSNAPGAVAVDAVSHNIIVEDYANNRIQVFDSNGTYLSQFGSAGNGGGQFNGSNGPTGLDLDQSSHQVVVLDRGNSRAELFAPSSLPPPPTCGPTQVSLSIDPLTASLSEAILFSAQASIAAPFTGTVSFLVDGTTAAACTASMVDVDAACTHPLNLGTHSIVAQYSGDGHNPPGCSAPQSVTVIPEGGQGPTNITCTFAPNPAVQGQPVVTTCSVGNGPVADSRTDANRPDTPTTPTGYVAFSQGTNILADEPLYNGTAVYATVLGGGSYSLSAGYSGDGGNATSTGQIPVVVHAPADDIFYGGFEIPPG